VKKCNANGKYLHFPLARKVCRMYVIMTFCVYSCSVVISHISWALCGKNNLIVYVRPWLKTHLQ